MASNSNFIPNSFQTPNDYVDKFMAFLTSEEWKVISYMVRRIWGFQKKQDRISLSQLASGITSRDGTPLDHGTGLSVNTIKKAVNSLIKAGLLMKIEPGTVNRLAALYALQLDSSLVNMAYLQSRLDQRKQVEEARTAKARKGQKPKNEQYHATSPVDEQYHATSPVDEQYHATSPVLYHATEVDCITPQPLQKTEETKGKQQGVSLSSSPISVNQDLINVMSWDDQKTKTDVSYFEKRFSDYPEQTLAYLAWAERSGKTCAHARNIDRQNNKIPTWQLKKSGEKSDQSGTRYHNPLTGEDMYL